MLKFKEGNLVKWCDSTYFIVEVRNDKAILKQNFSIGTTLLHPISFKELSLIK